MNRLSIKIVPAILLISSCLGTSALAYKESTRKDPRLGKVIVVTMDYGETYLCCMDMGPYNIDRSTGERDSIDGQPIPPRRNSRAALGAEGEEA